MPVLGRPPRWRQHAAASGLLVITAAWATVIGLLIASYLHWILAVIYGLIVFEAMQNLILNYILKNADDGPIMARLATGLGLIRNDRNMIQLPHRLDSPDFQ